GAPPAGPRGWARRYAHGWRPSTGGRPGDGATLPAPGGSPRASPGEDPLDHAPGLQEPPAEGRGAVPPPRQAARFRPRRLRPRGDVALVLHAAEGHVDGAALQPSVRGLDELQAVAVGGRGEHLEDEGLLAGEQRKAVALFHLDQYSR